MVQKCIVFLIGFMGSGKSYHGKRLSAVTGWDFVDLDEFIVRKHQLSINEMFTRGGENYFRQLEHLALLDVLKKSTPMIMATGGGTPCFFSHMDLFNSVGLTFYLDNPVEKLVSQLISGQNKRPLLKNKSPEELKEYVGLKIKERENYYFQTQWTIKCLPGTGPVEEILKILREQDCLQAG